MKSIGGIGAALALGISNNGWPAATDWRTKDKPKPVDQKKKAKRKAAKLARRRNRR